MPPDRKRAGLCKELRNVPVDQEYKDRLIAFLQVHGATATPKFTRKYTKPGVNKGEQVQSEYTSYNIAFPEGTRREEGLVLGLSAPFTIFFPDGTTLPGQQGYPISGGDLLTILFLPEVEGKP